VTGTADKTIYVLQGEFRISREADAVLSTILGSCVAVCLWDADAGLGGMNHFLLPFGPKAAASAPERYGVHAMELLINGLLKAGASRNRLQAKLFGGARVSTALSDIGQTNARFARAFLEAEGIPCRAESLGGTSARRVLFRPATGQARQLLVPETTLEPQAQRPAPPTPRAAAIELF
jgi:chemotaxis protein CheD